MENCQQHSVTNIENSVRVKFPGLALTSIRFIECPFVWDGLERKRWSPLTSLPTTSASQLLWCRSLFYCIATILIRCNWSLREKMTRIVISGTIRSKLFSARLCKDTSLTSLRPRSLPPPLKNPRRLWSKRRWCLVIGVVSLHNWVWPFSSSRSSQWEFFHIVNLSCETMQSLFEKTWWFWSQCDLI
jgi:hypothetical protein